MAHGSSCQIYLPIISALFQHRKIAAGSGHSDVALRSILMVHEKIGGTVEDMLSHPDAVPQVCAVERYTESRLNGASVGPGQERGHQVPVGRVAPARICHKTMYLNELPTPHGSEKIAFWGSRKL